MVCNNCGAKVKKGTKFCPNCGTEMADIAVDRERMSKAEEMTENCLGKNYLRPSGVQKLVDSTMQNILVNSFRTILQEIQEGEECLLYFAGMYDFGSGGKKYTPYAYMLTNRRLIMAGAFGSSFSTNIPYYNLRGLLLKEFKCAMKSVDYHELKDVTMSMVKGNDMITFQTDKQKIGVVFHHKDVTHKLYDEIKKIIERQIHVKDEER